MYQFSRAIYRELAPQILAPPPGAPAMQQPRGRAARLRGRDHPPGDRPPLLRAPGAHAVLRHPQLLPDVRPGPRAIASSPATWASPSSSWPNTRTRATRRSAAHRRSAARPPAKARPASARRCRTTATAPPTSTWPTPRTASSAAALKPRCRVGLPRRRMLLGVDVGGTFTDAVLVDDARAVHTAKVPSTPAEQSLAVLEAVRLVLARRRRAAAGGRALRARHDGRDERAARGPHGAHGADRDGGLHRRDRARAARPAPTSTGCARRRRRRWCRRSCASARPSAWAPDGPLRALDGELARRARRDALARAAPQAVAVSLLHSYADPAARARCSATLVARAAARRPPVALQRAGRHVPRVRAHRHDGARRGALAACWRPTCAGLARGRSRARACPSRRSCSPPAA